MKSFLACFHIWLFPGPSDRVLQIKFAWKMFVVVTLW